MLSRHSDFPSKRAMWWRRLVRRVKVRPPRSEGFFAGNRADDLQVSLALDAPPLIRPGRGLSSLICSSQSSNDSFARRP